jgi:hypothetical protein
MKPMIGYRILHEPVLPAYDAQVMEFCWAGNGIFLRAESKELSVLLPVAEGTTRGLAPAEPMVKMYAPRVPRELVELMIRRARSQAQLNPPLEILFRLRWTEEGGWELYEPHQEQSPGACRALEDERPGTVMEIHSHHRMKAFFSDDDDASDDVFLLYGVIGDVLRDPVLILRAGVHGYHAPLRAQDFLELDKKEGGWMPRRPDRSKLVAGMCARPRCGQI